MTGKLAFGLGRNELLFSFKMGLSALVSLWIAMRLGLGKPYWAMATAFIVAQPLAATVTSKAIFRVVGTLVGAAITVLLIPNLVNAPELLCAALAIWVGGCLYISLLDRSPRSYVALLAGYTAAIIGFPAVSQPLTVFDIALSRSEEIIIGISVSALISRLLFPQHLGPVLSMRLSAWMTTAGQWAGDVLRQRVADEGLRQDRSKLAADTVDMILMTTHLPYDTTDARYTTGMVRQLQQHMIALLPVLSGIEDRLSDLRELPSGAEHLPAAIAAWIEEGPMGPDPVGAALLARIEALEQSFVDDRGQWQSLVLLNLTERLRSFIELWANARQMLRALMEERTCRPHYRRATARYGGSTSLHADHQLAAMAGATAALAILVTCLFWISTGWNEGTGAAVMAAIFSSLFAFLDNPVPLMRKLTRLTVVATVVAGLVVFGAAPLVDSFQGLMLIFVPFLLISGVLMAMPRFGPLGFMLCVNLALAGQFGVEPSYDFAQFVNTNLASTFGLLISTTATAMFGVISASRSVSRLLQASWRDLARFCALNEVGNAAVLRQSVVLTHRLVDRFAQIALRSGMSPGLKPENVLKELRIGLNVADLTIACRALEPRQQASVADLRLALSRHFRKGDPLMGDDSDSDTRLQTLLDDTLRICIAAAGTDSGRTALRALVGIRQGLYPGLSEPDLSSFAIQQRRSA